MAVTLSKEIVSEIEELEEKKPGLFIAQDYTGKGTLFVDTRKDEPAVYAYHDGNSIDLPDNVLPDSVKEFKAHVAAQGTQKLFNFTETGEKQ